MPPAESPKITPADAFRDALEATRDIANALAPYCTTVTDLVGMIELGMANDGQLQMLMEKVTTPKGGKSR